MKHTTESKAALTRLIRHTKRTICRYCLKRVYSYYDGHNDRTNAVPIKTCSKDVHEANMFRSCLRSVRLSSCLHWTTFLSVWLWELHAALKSRWEKRGLGGADQMLSTCTNKDISLFFFKYISFYAPHPRRWDTSLQPAWKPNWSNPYRHFVLMFTKCPVLQRK